MKEVWPIHLIVLVIDMAYRFSVSKASVRGVASGPIRFTEKGMTCTHVHFSGKGVVYSHDGFREGDLVNLPISFT